MLRQSNDRTRDATRIAPGRTIKGLRVFRRKVMAAMRAFLAVSLVAAPALILPGVTPESRELAVFVALLIGAFVYVEYRSEYPSLVEFRDAAPYNRIRGTILCLGVLGVTLVCRAAFDPDLDDTIVAALGRALGEALDFPFSPVRLMLMVADDAAAPAELAALTASLGLVYAISLGGILVFALVVRLLDWPLGNGGFNVWVNLPLFDPTRGEDVLRRLEREAHLNVALGFLVPFIVPAVMQTVAPGVALPHIDAPQTAIWVISLWGFLSASLVMRGIALMRIAALIAEKRRRAYRHADVHPA